MRSVRNYPPVLVVDDKEMNRISFKNALEVDHFEVVEAASGAEALAYLLNHSVSLILLDVQMPEMNGFELAQAIKEDDRHNKVPILFITATQRSEQFINHGYSVGAFDYLTKPIEVDLLRNKVRLFHTLYRQQVELESSNHKLNHLNRQLEQNAIYLAHERRYVERIFQSMREPLLVVDYQGMIQDCNPALEQMTGRSWDELRGHRIRDLFTIDPSDGVDNTSQRAMEYYFTHMQEHYRRSTAAMEHYLQQIPLPVALIPLPAHPQEAAEKLPQLLMNRALAQMLDYPQGDFTPQTLDSVLVKEDVARLQHWMDELTQCGARKMADCCFIGEVGLCHETKGLFRFLTARGEEVPLHLCLLTLEHEGSSHLLLTLKDGNTLRPEVLQFTEFGAQLAQAAEDQEWQLVAGNGGSIPVAISSSMLDTGDENEGYVLVLNDLRERKRLESREQYAAFQSGVAEMSANILHNVGNTIQGALTMQEELEFAYRDFKKVVKVYQNLLSSLEQSDSPEAIRIAEQRLIEGGERLPGVLSQISEVMHEPIHSIGVGVRHIRDVVKAQQNGVKVEQSAVYFSLNDLMSDLLVLSAPLIGHYGIELIHTLEEGLPEVRLSRNQLLQA